MSDVDTITERIFADPAFTALKRYVIQTTGLSYYEDKDRDLARGVARALGGAAFRSASAYLSDLAAPEGKALDRLVEELTIGETFFFRHVEMFDALREHVLPEIHDRGKEQKRLRIWSAGCSIGAEPYSLSIMLRDELDHLFHDWSVEIIGTDINRRFLQMAREGAYESWALRGMSEEMKRRHFDQQGKKWELKPRFKDGVTFQHHNLVRDRFPSLGNNLFAFDVIICRNVMIYFTNETVRKLAEQFHQTLVPGGWLVVGHAEPHTEIFRAFRTVNAPGAILYQRSTAHSAPPAAIQWAEMRKKVAPPAEWQPPILGGSIFRDAAQVVEPISSATASVDENKGACFGLESVRQMADAGDLLSARSCCEHLLERETMNPEIYLFYGLILAQIGASTAAREALRKAIYLDRSLVLGHYHLGTVQRRLGDEALAARSLRNALALTEGVAEDQPVRCGDGMTVSDLRNAVSMQMNQRPERVS